MYDKDLIDRLCNLTCNEEDVVRNQTTVKYDNIEPFKKYYSVDTLVGAIEKYINKEWDDIMLSHWACIYCWILNGGFRDDIKENLNSFEEFLANVLTWNLDGLSFFDEEYLDEDEKIEDYSDFYKNFDHVWQTRNEWHCFYATIGQFDKFNGHQYVVMINDNLKEYMIIVSDHLKNGYRYSNDYLKYTTKSKFFKLIEKLKTDNYLLITCSEKWYYKALNNDK